jgi:hypothetical protein
MATSNLKETDLIGKVLKRYPHGERILLRHFGDKFLERESAKVLSLSMACILRGISLTALLDDLQGFNRKEMFR